MVRIVLACVLVLGPAFAAYGQEQPQPLVLYPGAAIMLTVFGLNLVGDGLRDVLDPKLRGFSPEKQ